MPSILPGYEYDIFISYRHKDNKTGWVTEFVENLKNEIEATFKEDISIYFDSNPHDGLHETHDVDGSLKEKVKCLIFIPVVSQTYCDPKAFAWQKEFIPFLEFAGSDEFGLDIKLPGGNVSKRVLPIRIHEIDQADAKLFEKAQDGVMRSINFIFKSTGINRPLTLDDNRELNVFKSQYRDQINKAANAIKELVSAILGQSSTITSVFSDSTDEPDDLSIAVLPFANLSQDTAQEYFADGMTDEIANALTQISNIKIAGRTSSFSFKGKNEDLRDIGKKLNVRNIIEGSVRVVNNKVRINTQLIECATGFNMWSERYDEEVTDIFGVQEKIANSIISKLKDTFNARQRKTFSKSYTSDLDIYNKYLNARFHYNQRSQEGIFKAINILESVIQKDPDFAPAYATMSDCYRIALLGYASIPKEEALAKIKETSLKALELDPELDTVHASLGHTYLMVQNNIEKSLYHLEKALEINPNNIEALQWLGWDYTSLNEFDKASEYYQSALELDPYSVGLMTEAGWPYMYAGNLDKAAEYFKKASEIDSNYGLAHFDLGNTLILQGQYDEGFALIDKALGQSGDMGMMLGVYGYFKAKLGDLDTAEKSLNKLLKQQDDGIPVAFSIADIYEGMNNKSEALKWLETSYENQEVWLPLAETWRKGHLQSDLLLDDPQFKSLMIKAKKPRDFLSD